MMDISSSTRTPGRDAPFHASKRSAHAWIPPPVLAPGMAFDARFARAYGACETRPEARLNKVFSGLILLDGNIG
jgi:hypothetical protein